MNITTLAVGMLASNCYIVGCPDTGEGVVIDPGSSASKILKEIEKLKLKIKAIINTHGHYDHVGANGKVQEATGAPILLHKKDLELYKKPGAGLSIILKTPPPPHRYLAEGDTVPCGNSELKVIETPGHTKGGISLVLNNEKTVIFTGDTLFQMSIGRTDLAGGSFQEIVSSIKEKILIYPDDTIIYPGHGPSSIVGQEKIANPFLR